MDDDDAHRQLLDRQRSAMHLEEAEQAGRRHIDRLRERAVEVRRVLLKNF